MNRIFSLLAALLIIWSCSDNNETPSTTLTGKWLLVEEKIGTGPSGEWLSPQNPVTVEFKSDSTFTSTARPNCTGTYSVHGGRIDFNLDCSGTPVVWSDKFKLDTNLFLTPAVISCDEGCEYKYERL